jgi:hypothetical protein
VDSISTLATLVPVAMASLASLSVVIMFVSVALMDVSIPVCLDVILVFRFVARLLQVVRSTAVETNGCSLSLSGKEDGLSSCSWTCDPSPRVMFTHFHKVTAKNC